MDLSLLTPAERFAYEWQYAMLGGFKANLAEAIARADQENTWKLSLLFPDEVEGVKSFQQIEGWWENVLQVAQSDSHPTP